MEEKVLERQPSLRKKPTLVEKTTSAGTEAQGNNDSKLEEIEGLTFENGAVYNGQLKDGNRHGKGTQVWPDGAKYVGAWENNTANGLGKFYHADGDIYEGEWVNDKANGKGKYVHLNGATYNGEWKEDLQHG